MRRWSYRLLAVAVLTAVAASAHAESWLDVAVVSMSTPDTARLTGRHLCLTDGDTISCEGPSPYMTTLGLIGVGNTNPNATLDVYGTVSATNFIGDGSGLTGIASGAADRITSGTTQFVTISNTGYVSLTQAGTNTGWFSPYTGLVTLGVSATGRISGSSGYFYGNVGIGTGSPVAPLSINTVASSTFIIANGGSELLKVYSNNAGNNALYLSGKNALQSSGNQLIFGNDAATSTLYFYAGGTQRMVANATGVGIGVSAPSPMASLQVSGSFIVSTSAQTTTPTLFAGTDGKVGIGTSAPGAKLNVVDGSASLPLLLNDGGYIYSFGQGSALTNTFTFRGQVGRSQISYPTANALVFMNGSAERVRFTKDGTVGILTNAPSATLDVNGTISASDAIQVGSSSLTCTSGIPGAIRHHSGDLQYCNGTAWTTVGNGTVSGTGAANHIAYWSGSNVLTHDANQLYWDASNNRLGIGTGSPQAMLNVSGGTVLSQNESNWNDIRTETYGNASNFYGGFVIRNARGTRVAPSAVLSGNKLGQLRWYGYGDDSFGSGSGAADIAALAEADFTNASRPTSLVFSTASAGTAAERMRLTSQGYLGIGSASPNARLVLGGAAGGEGGFLIATSTSRTLSFGNVGTGAPGVGSNGMKLQLYGTNAGVMSNNDYAMGIEGGNLWFNTGGSGASGFRWYASSAQRMSLDANGNLQVSGAISASDAIQVGSSSLTCSPSIGGAVRYSSPSIQVCNGGDWVTISGGQAVSNTGAIQFQAGGGSFGGDTSNLHWNNANKALFVSNSLVVNYGIYLGADDLASNYFRFNSGASGYNVMAFANADTEKGRIQYQNSNDSLQFNVNNDERMRITSDGRLGIGTTAPSSTLQVGPAITHSGGIAYQPAVMIRTNIDGTSGLRVQAGSGTSVIAAHRASDSAVVFEVKDNGKVGIGTANPTVSLHVSAEAGGNSGLLMSDIDGDPVLYVRDASSDTLTNGMFSLYGNNGAESIRLYAYPNDDSWLYGNGGTGKLGIGTSSPTMKLHVAGSVAVTNGGMLGVGTSSPTAPLDIAGTGTAMLRLRGPGTGVPSVGTVPRQDLPDILS